jgi:Ser/Thr protein kinase RdoA (MazF antagonist)
MHTVSEIVAHASAVGLVTQREVRSGLVSVRSAPGNADVQAVLVSDRPVGYVKAATSWPGDADPVTRERVALQSLGDVDLGPRLLAGPEDSLWVGVVQGQRLSQVNASLPDLAEICETWGSAVATLHRLPVDGPPLPLASHPRAMPLARHRRPVPPAPRPWLLDADRRARSATRLGRTRGPADVVRALDDEPRLRSAAAQVAARWTDRHWMHGGLTADNVVVQAAQPVRVRFFSFADAGLGDPAWDLATVLDTITWLARRRRTPAEPLADYFLRGYRRSGGPGALWPAIQAVRALATAWQLAGGTSSSGGLPLPDAELRFWLDRARAFADRAGRWHREAA